MRVANRKSISDFGCHRLVALLTKEIRVVKLALTQEPAGSQRASTIALRTTGPSAALLATATSI